MEFYANGASAVVAGADAPALNMPPGDPVKRAGPGETEGGPASLHGMPIALSPLEQVFVVSLALTAAAQLYIERRLRRR